MPESSYRMIVLAVVALLLGLTTGCRDPDSSDMLGPVDNRLVVRVAVPSFGEATFLNWNGGSSRKFYLDALYDYLVYLNPEDGTLLPGLASTWMISADGLTITLALRKDIHFHNGWGALTADDVQFSLERTMAADSRAGPASTLRQAIKSIQVLDSHSLVIRLYQPDIDFVRAYLTNGQQLPILSRHYIETVGDNRANQQPIGSGPMQLHTHRPGSAIVLRAVENHWRSSPQFQELLFLLVPDESTRVAMLVAGEVDIAPISFDSIEKIKKRGLKILSMQQNWSPVVRMGGLVTTNEKLHNANVPWANKQVRQALNYAVNKEQIIKAIFHGEAQSAGMDFPASTWAQIPSYSFDPEKARQLLKDAGYEQGFRLSLKTFPSSPGADLPLIAEVIAQYWRDIGIDAKVIPVDWATLRGTIVNGKSNDSLWTHRGLAFSNPVMGLQMSTSANSLFATYSDQHTEQLLREIGAELDKAKRDSLVKELGFYLHDQAAAIYIAFANEPFGVSHRIASWPRISDHLTNFDQIVLAAPQ